MASTRHLYFRLANVEMVGMQSSPDVHYAESMEKLPLQSHASTEAEETPNSSVKHLSIFDRRFIHPWQKYQKQNATA
nr:hypothetical protein CFP56_68437 [Quercus suber]